MSFPVQNTRGGRIDAVTLAGWLEGNVDVRVLDVRTPGEFETVHIPGSFNVPLDTLREHREALRRHLDERVVLVCQSGARAEQAGQTLAEIGLPNLLVLDGGVAAWQAAGQAVERGERQRWDIERQVRLIAGAIVLLAVLASVFVPAMKWLAAAIGAGLAIAALTNTCTMGMLLARLPYNRGATCSVDKIIAQLADESR